MRLTQLAQFLFTCVVYVSCTSANSDIPVEAVVPPASDTVKGSEVDTAQIEQPTKVEPNTECPPTDTVCPMNWAPVMCTVNTPDEKQQSGTVRLVAWGSNNCVGRLKLSKDACARNLRPSKLGRIQCVPDASGGHCPITEVDCKGGGKSSTCSAGSYGGHPLTEEQRLTAEAANECLARSELQMVACRQNLDPTQLGDISCRHGKHVK